MKNRPGWVWTPSGFWGRTQVFGAFCRIPVARFFTPKTPILMPNNMVPLVLCSPTFLRPLTTLNGHKQQQSNLPLNNPTKTPLKPATRRFFWKNSRTQISPPKLMIYIWKQSLYYNKSHTYIHINNWFLNNPQNQKKITTIKNRNPKLR